MRYNATFSDRFWRKVRIGAPDECWPWTAMTNGEAGYGQIKASAEVGMVLAHRCRGLQQRRVSQLWRTYRKRFAAQLASAATRLRDSSTGRYTRKELTHVS